MILVESLCHLASDSKNDFHKTLSGREREKFIIRQPPIGEKDDYDSKNS